MATQMRIPQWTVGDRLRKAREDADLGVEQIAVLMGRNRNTVTRYERSRTADLEATAHKLRATFGTELARATEGNVILIARMMGHEDISTSMAYVGWAGGPAAEAIGAMFPPAA